MNFANLRIVILFTDKLCNDFLQNFEKLDRKYHNISRNGRKLPEKFEIKMYVEVLRE
jgi:hypothetical protein